VAGGNTAAAALARVDLFAALTPEELERLGARLRRRRYPKGAVILVEGDPGTGLYVLESGRARIVVASPAGRELVLDVRGPGEFFGDMALLDGEPRSADVVAAEDCRVLILQREDFVRFVETHPQAALRLLAVLSRRLRRLTRQHRDATLLDVAARVASALLRLADEDGAPAGDGTGVVVIPTTLTQADLAAQVGVTRESVNKWLRYYQRRGWIHWEPGHLTLLQPAKLRERLT
jgi:CRP/FNR family transcriptional regulator, cyclic AMP receptor protein